ncbi:MAG: hypothetical protein U1E14_09230 [Geminicoccaceae bacterium]
MTTRRACRLALAAILLAGTAAAAPTQEGGVTVYRGPGSGPAPAVAKPAPQPALLAGQRLWVVDPETGRMVACRQEFTATVGVRRIVCSGRALPRP